jgi:hypothetical protein
LEIASAKFPRMGAKLISEFSLPSFGQNFSEEGIVDPDLRTRLEEAILKFDNAIR